MLLPKKKQRLMLIPSWPSHSRRVRARPRASVHRRLRRRLRIGDPLSFRDNPRRPLRTRCGCRQMAGTINKSACVSSLSGLVASVSPL